MADENETGTERQAGLSSGWTPFTARSGDEWETRGKEINRRAKGDMIYTTEQIYLPACEVAHYYETLKPWKKLGISKKVWLKTVSPMRGHFGSTTTWNDLLNLFTLRDMWEKAKREYQTQNSEWEPKHSSSTLWPLEIIRDMIDNHPRDLREAVAGPKKVKAEVWKARYEAARDLLAEIDDPDISEIVAKMDQEVAQDEKAAPVIVKATDDIQSRMERVKETPRDKSPEGEAKARMLEQYEDNMERFEVAGLDPRPISKDYEPSAVVFWRMMNAAQEYEDAIAAEHALDLAAGKAVTEDLFGKSFAGIDNLTSEVALWNAPVIVNSRRFDLMLDRFAEAGEMAVRKLQAGGDIYDVQTLLSDVWNDARPAKIDEIEGYDGQDLDGLDSEIIGPLMRFCGPISHQSERADDGVKVVAHANGLVLEFWDYGFEVVKVKAIIAKPNREAIWKKGIRAAKIGSDQVWNLKKLAASVPEDDADFDAWITLVRELYPCVGERDTHTHIGFDLAWWCPAFALRWIINGRKFKKQLASDPALAPVLDI
jgi:hypothetical protein